MKEQQPVKAYDHSRDHEKMKSKNDVHLQKNPVQPEVKKPTAQQPPAGRETHKVVNESHDRAEKVMSGHEFSGLDFDKIYKFHDELDKDDHLKQRFQQHPEAVLQEYNVGVPEGYKASYDNQYVKPSDGTNVGMYGYRVGNILFTK